MVRVLFGLAVAGASVFVLLACLVPRTSAPRQTGHMAVRPAGPRNMTDPPASWDMVDERADESFPASDPPGTY